MSMSILRRIANLFQRSKLDQEIEAELRSHIEMRTADNIAAGMSPEEARRQAVLRFGSRAAMKERVIAADAQMFLDSLWQDLRYGLRVLRKSPGFAAVAVLTLALGIGANTAIFSAVNGILLKPQPYADPSQLVTLGGVKRFPNGIMGNMDFPPDVWTKVRTQTPAIAQMAFWSRGEYTVTGDAAPELLSAALVSSEFFRVMGTRPIVGRAIIPSDTQPGAKAVVVVSYPLWRERWGGANSVLGSTIALNNRPYEVVGVMPPSFDFPISSVENEGKGVWLPLILPPGKEATGSSTDVYVVARLKKGVSIQAANAHLRIVSTGMAGNFVGWMKGGYVDARGMKPTFGDLDSALLILLGAVCFVLLIACVNVSGLLLARGWSRQREVAIRQALGAARGRIVRQFLTESLLLALAGGVLGLMFSYWGVHVLRAITPTNTPEHGSFLLNGKILWFTLTVSLLTGILFGLAPALQASSRRIGAALSEGLGGSLGSASARRPRKLRSALVVIEVALAVMLVIGATLVARSFGKLMSVKLGFRTDHILTMDANFSKSICDGDKSDRLAGCGAAVLDVVRRMREIPGVQSAAATSTKPLDAWSMTYSVRIEGQSRDISFDTGAMIVDREISGEYFRTFGIRLLSGRSFTDEDTSGSPRVAIVNETFTRKYLSGRVLGQRISDIKDKDGHPEWMEIVGVASDARDVGLDEEPNAEIYIPFGQAEYYSGASFVARTSADPMAMAPALRRAIWSVDKDAPITDLLTMDQLVAESVSDSRYQAILLGSFGALGLILAMVGIYGVISYAVSQRTREFGVRMALGAQQGSILRMVIREGMLLVVAGIAIGVGGALALGGVLRSLLFEVKPTDPPTFVAVALALALVALAACWIPARRAMRVDPMVALRYE
jgi:predicted permease